MNQLARLVAAVAVALPVAAFAQAAPNVKPADQPRTPLEQQQTTQNGQATKYGAPGMDTGSGSMGKDGSMAPMKHKGMKSRSGSANTTKPGDVPTYPAPAADGTPTSPSTTK